MTDESLAATDQRMDLAVLLGALLARWLRVVLVTILLLAATFAVLLFVPKMYESTAALLVEQRSSALTTGEQPQQPTIPVEAMMSSQIELIKSRDTLLSVVESEDLRSVPELSNAGSSPVSLLLQILGRKPEVRSLDQIVLQNLYERLTVVRERDSAVISIIVRTTDPELSARIANAIAIAHVRRRAGLTLSDTVEAAEGLEQEIERLRDSVREAETAVANYRIENDLFSGTNNTSLLDQQLSNIANQINAAQERKNTARSRAELIRQLVDAGQSLEGITDVRNSVVVQQLTQSKANLQGELAQRSSTLLPNHPVIKALTAQVREIEGQIALEGRRIANALEAEARVEENLEASLRDDMTRLKLSVSNATKDTVTLDSLEREAKAQRDLLERYLSRYSDAISRTESNSAPPDVRVVTVAAPAAQPASPKTALTLGAVALVALTLQIGGILFGELMSGRAVTTRTTFVTADSTPAPAAEITVHRSELTVSDDRHDLTVIETDSVAAEQPPEPTAGDPPGSPATAPLPTQILAALADPLDEPVFEDVEATAVVAQDLASPEAPTDHVDEDSVETAAPELPHAVVEPARPVPDTDLEHDLAAVIEDFAAGGRQVMMLATLGSFRDLLGVADTLISEFMEKGLSVVLVDAASAAPTGEPGVTDLSAGTASFGDVVHAVGAGLAEVPWGTLPALERRSMKPATLVAALTDIYDVVMVTTGRMGLSSALPLFAGTDAELVLVTSGPVGEDRIGVAREDAAALGYAISHTVAVPLPQSKVA